MLDSLKFVNSLLLLGAQLDAVFQMWPDERRVMGKKSFSWNTHFPLFQSPFFFLASNLFSWEKTNNNLVGISPALHACCYLPYHVLHFFPFGFSLFFHCLLDIFFCFFFKIMFPGPFCINLCTCKIANFRVVTGTVKAWTILCLPTISFISEYLPSEFKYSQHPSTTSIQFTTFSICREYKYSFVFSSSNPWVSMVSCGRSSMWSWLWKMSSFLMKAGGCPVEMREFQLSIQQKAWGLQFLSRHGGLKYYDFSPPKHCRSRQESN